MDDQEKIIQKTNSALLYLDSKTGKIKELNKTVYELTEKQKRDLLLYFKKRLIADSEYADFLYNNGDLSEKEAIIRLEANDMVIKELNICLSYLNSRVIDENPQKRKRGLVSVLRSYIINK